MQHLSCKAVEPNLALCRNAHGSCKVASLERYSQRANCTPGETFGCQPRPDGSQYVWLRAGCRGKFECGERRGSFTCGTFRLKQERCPCGSFASPLNSTLVAMIGSVRGGRLPIETLARHLLAPLSADLAVLCAYEVPWNEPILRLAKHIWRVPEYADWELLINETLQPLDPYWKARGVWFASNLWGSFARHARLRRDNLLSPDGTAALP